MENTRLRTAAVGLVIGLFLFSVGDLCRRLVDHGVSGSDVALRDAVADHQGLWLLAALCSAACAFLAVPGLLALGSTARGRGARWTRIGAALVAVGTVAGVGHAVGYFDPPSVAARAGLDDATVRSVDAAAFALDGVLIALFMVGMMIGTLVLFVGLRRARRVPIWAVVAAVLFVVAGSVGDVAAGVIGLIAAMAAYGSAARALSQTERPGPVAFTEPVVDARAASAQG